MRTLVERLDRQTKILVAAAAGATLILFVGGWLLFVSPKHSQAAHLKAKVALARERLAVERARPSQERLTAAEVRQLEVALPDGPDMSTLVRQLDRLARGAGVTLESIAPAASTGGSGYTGVPLSVVVDGKFFAVDRFLALLRKQVRVRAHAVHGTGRLLDVQAIDLEQSTTPRPNVRATLTMEAYTFGGSPAAPAGAASEGSAGSGAGATG